MGVPSISTLTRRLGVDMVKAKKLRWIMQQNDMEEIYGAFPDLPERGMVADLAMEAINVVLETYGVESLRDANYWDSYYCDHVAIYANMGDTYDTTILYDRDNGRFIVTSYGDWIETEERRGRNFNP
jgi:predicted RNase H-like nuclease